MSLLIYMFMLHFIADFICQSREMGQKKSSEWEWLAKHLLIQFVFFSFGLSFYSLFFDLSVRGILMVPILNTIIHGVIDWNIWRGYKLFTMNRLLKLSYKSTYMNGNLNISWDDRAKEEHVKIIKDFKYWEDHWFYTTIGFDQLLHSVTIISLYGTLV